MEAHTGTASFPGRFTKGPRRRRFAEVTSALRRRRAMRAERAKNMRALRARTYSVPGTEHAHLVRRPPGF
jgi:hypothetical protein